MGNHPSKQENSQSSHNQAGSTSLTGSVSSSQPHTSSQTETNTSRPESSRRRSGRHESLGIFNIGNRPDVDPTSPEARRETRPEREARRLEKERAQRAVDREKSIKEEHVDGGFLVTLGTYTGTEDFSKPIVRRLQIERRLAPFWKGLQDHEDDWADNQLVAAAKGLSIPPPQENTLHIRSVLETQQIPNAEATTPDSSHSNVNFPSIISQSINIPSYPDSPFNNSPSLSPSHPAFSSSFSSANITSSSPQDQASHKNPLLRGRAKTLASITSSLSRHSSAQEVALQEKSLPHDPYYNGAPLEAALYKQAKECPICFLYYPPYLNMTRCCDQPICSECFVQIKRPDPHQPEHADPSLPLPNTTASSLPATTTPVQSTDIEPELVSEPATCPFCKESNFGITYEPPPFRRGIVYPNRPHLGSAMSSASSISSQGHSGHSRRRNQSISADAPNVITSDHIRPEWNKKLADARAQAMRRSAAATALHTAAFASNIVDGDSRLPFGRRRRTLFGGDPSPSAFIIPVRHGPSSREPTSADQSQHSAAGPSDLAPGRSSSRRNRIEELEQAMLNEAIRQSLQTEQDRKKQDNGKKSKKTTASESSSAAAGSASTEPMTEGQSSGPPSPYRSLDGVIGNDQAQPHTAS